MTLDSRLAQAIADAGAPVVTVFAVHLARIGYEMAVEDAKRELEARADLHRTNKAWAANEGSRFAATEAALCSRVLGKLKVKP